jgi:hypothetical protein
MILSLKDLKDLSKYTEESNSSSSMNVVQELDVYNFNEEDSVSKSDEEEESDVAIVINDK